jgi:hypothetical protein
MSGRTLLSYSRETRMNISGSVSKKKEGSLAHSFEVDVEIGGRKWHAGRPAYLVLAAGWAAFAARSALSLRGPTVVALTACAFAACFRQR